MIVPRQSVPIDTSSPAGVVKPLWHAMQVSAVVKRGPSPFAAFPRAVGWPAIGSTPTRNEANQIATAAAIRARIIATRRRTRRRTNPKAST